MSNLGLVLLILAFLCALAASWKWSVPWGDRINLIAMALMFYFAALVFGAVGPFIR